MKVTFEGFQERSRLDPYDARVACGKLTLEVTNCAEAEVLGKFLQKLIGYKEKVGLPLIVRGEGAVDSKELKW